MFGSILVPLDGSTFSEHAIPLARMIASRADAEMALALVHEIPLSGDPAAGEMLHWELQQRRSEADYLEVVARRISEDWGHPVAHRLLDGLSVPAEIERCIEEGSHDLVVMTTHGRAGLERAWLGSVADGLIRRSAVPVLLVRPMTDSASITGEALPFRHIAVALDGGSAAEAALAPALRLARLTDADVTLVRIAAPPAAVTSPYIPHQTVQNREELARRRHEAEEYLAAQAAAIADRESVDVDTVVRADWHPAHGILQAAADAGADLIVVGTHGRAPLTRMVLGSTADKVVRSTDVPVLVCRG